MKETVIRVRWVTHESSDHLLTFQDDEEGLKSAGDFSDYLLRKGAMQVKISREAMDNKAFKNVQVLEARRVSAQEDGAPDVTEIDE